MEDHDAVADGELRDTFADCRNRPGGLVAEDARGRVRAGCDLLQIGPAYAAGADFDEDFAAPDFGTGTVSSLTSFFPR